VWLQAAAAARETGRTRCHITVKVHSHALSLPLRGASDVKPATTICSSALSAAIKPLLLLLLLLLLLQCNHCYYALLLTVTESALTLTPQKLSASSVCRLSLVAELLESSVVALGE
jgi:hypothetical protein